MCFIWEMSDASLFFSWLGKVDNDKTKGRSKEFQNIRSVIKKKEEKFRKDNQMRQLHNNAVQHWQYCDVLLHKSKVNAWNWWKMNFRRPYFVEMTVVFMKITFSNWFKILWFQLISHISIVLMYTNSVKINNNSIVKYSITYK